MIWDIPSQGYSDPPATQKYLHERSAMSWNEWKITFLIFSFWVKVVQKTSNSLKNVKKNIYLRRCSNFLKRVYVCSGHLCDFFIFWDMFNFVLELRSELGTWTNSEEKVCMLGASATPKLPGSRGFFLDYFRFSLLNLLFHLNIFLFSLF